MEFHEALSVAYGREMTGDSPVKIQTYASGNVLFMVPEGVRFDCTGCGKCCSQPVPLQPTEVSTHEYEYDREDISERHKAYPVLKRCDGKCKYLSGTSCSIYQKRPRACRVYPMSYNAQLSKLHKKHVYTWYVNTDTNKCPGFNPGMMQAEDFERFLPAIKAQLKEEGVL